MGGNIYTSALSGMNMAQIGLATTQHNISNANTPGFTRQELVLAPRPGGLTGGLFLGSGVDVAGVQRIYDQFLSTQVLQDQAQASYLTSYHNAIKPLDSMLADQASGPSAALQSFFAAANSVASNPESLPARQTMLSNAQFAAGRFKAVDQRLTDIANGITAQVSGSVDSINSYATQIAALNGNIKRALGSSQGQPPNDLLDQRDQLITKLNQEIKATTVKQPDGTLSVFVGNGQTLVIDEQAMSMRVVQSTNDPNMVEVAYQTATATVPLGKSSLQGGNLGAYLTFRDQTLEPMRNELGRVALGLAISVNQQNQAGMDMNNQMGGAIFSVAVPQVQPSATNLSNVTITASIADVGALTASDYQLTVNGVNDYTLLRLSDNLATRLAGPLPQTVDGFTIDAPIGVPASGDSYLIRPTANAARDIAVIPVDPRAIAAAAPIRGAAASTNTGTGSITSGVVNPTPPLDPNLQAPVSITFDNPPTTFSVVGTGTGDPVAVPYVAGQDIVYNGWTVRISGAPAAGDVFTVSPNTNAAGDNRNALLMAGLQTTNVLQNGTLSILGGYGQLVGRVGAKTNELALTSQAQNSMLAASVQAQQSVSGVNLDEEAANLIRYQRAYEAAAKALQISTNMFDAILSIGG